eukprot:COSAG04_NODE_1105_length_8235_cov_48.668142_11_plen_207_part_00
MPTLTKFGHVLSEQNPQAENHMSLQLCRALMSRLAARPSAGFPPAVTTCDAGANASREAVSFPTSPPTATAEAHGQPTAENPWGGGPESLLPEPSCDAHSGACACLPRGRLDLLGAGGWVSVPEPADVEWPCPECDQSAEYGSVCCDGCSKWVHTRCDSAALAHCGSGADPDCSPTRRPIDKRSTADAVPGRGWRYEGKKTPQRPL